MAWKQIGSWGTHQERKERRRHRRGNDEREAVEAEVEATSFHYDPNEHYAPVKLVPVAEDSIEDW